MVLVPEIKGKFYFSPTYMVYNYARVHQTLRVTPAMEAGLADHVCGLEDIVALLD